MAVEVGRVEARNNSFACLFESSQTRRIFSASGMQGQCSRGQEAFALCHFLPARHPAGTPRIAPPPGQIRKGRAAAQFSEQGENRCGAALQTRGESGRGRRQPVSGERRLDDRRGPSRSPTGPTSDRPDFPLAGNRAPLPRPSRSFSAGRSVRAAGLGWNLRKSRSRRSGFAVFRARAKEIPHP